MKGIAGKVTLVTGGSSGIGRAAALAFAREGAKVVVADVMVDGGEETVQMIKEAGGEAMFVRADVSQAAEVEALVNKVVSTYGRLDCAHNNAGIEGVRADTADYPEDNWNRVIGVNLTGVYLCMKHEIAQMLKQGGGAIVNTASASGLVGTGPNAAYVASKHGVVGLTKRAAMEYGKLGVRINAVCPGVTLTPMAERLMGGSGPDMQARAGAVQPLERIGMPEEIAEAVVWLCSDAASFVHGHAMSVDGGLVIQ